METLLFLIAGLAVTLGSIQILHAGILAPVPTLGIIFAGGFLLSVWVAIRLHNAWRHLSPAERANNLVLDQMRWLFTFEAIFLAADSFPHVTLVILGFPDQIVTTAHWTAHLFLFIYLVIAVRMAVSFFHPGWKNYATGFVVIVSIAALIVSVMRPDYLVYVPGSSYPLVSSDPLYALFNMISNLTSAGIFGLYLIVYSFIRGSFVTRARAFLLGVGFWSLCWLGFLIHYSHSPNTFELIYIAFMGWSTCTGLGALYGATWRRN